MSFSPATDSWDPGSVLSASHPAEQPCGLSAFADTFSLKEFAFSELGAPQGGPKKKELLSKTTAYAVSVGISAQ